MIRFCKSFSCLLSLLIVAHVCSAADRSSIPSSISPVYEEMVGNQVFLLWNYMVQKKELKPNESFFIAGWGEEESPLAHQVVSSLKHYHKKAARGQFRFLKNWKDRQKDTRFSGVILVGATSLDGIRKLQLENFQEIASLFSASQSKGFLMVFADGSLARIGLLESIFEGTGLQTRSVMSLSELEFVEDEFNRQAVNLDFPQYRNRILERLVRQGMNPVHAHPVVDQAIQDFRKSQEPKILIVSKN